MSTEFRLKKLRGSGGYVMASVNDDQQRKGNLGGPDLFLAPIGRLDSEKISKYYCNTCEKEYEGSPRIDYESPNEVVADNLVLLEKGQYLCTTCGSVLAEYRNFSKPDEKADVGPARPQAPQQPPYAAPTPEPQIPVQAAETSGVKTGRSRKRDWHPARTVWHHSCNYQDRRHGSRCQVGGDKEDRGNSFAWGRGQLRYQVRQVRKHQHAVVQVLRDLRQQAKVKTCHLATGLKLLPAATARVVRNRARFIFGVGRRRTVEKTGSFGFCKGYHNRRNRDCNNLGRP